MWLPEIRRRIMFALKHGPLNPFELADVLEEAPFRVQQELKELRRAQLVRAHLEATEVTWRLTSRGELYAWNAAQEELPT